MLVFFLWVYRENNRKTFRVKKKLQVNRYVKKMGLFFGWSSRCLSVSTPPERFLFVITQARWILMLLRGNGERQTEGEENFLVVSIFWTLNYSFFFTVFSHWRNNQRINDEKKNWHIHLIFVNNEWKKKLITSHQWEREND